MTDERLHALCVSARAKATRQVTVRDSGTLPPHRSDRNRNTDHFDQRLRDLREFGIR